ncbi:MAG: hypothetical protein HY000_38395 [Planctomycetes bacterium]|nr:hypothetical protein [Planctomycetota bacterium]
MRFKAPGDVTQKAAVVLIYIYRPQVLGPNFSDRLTRVIAIGYELARRPNENDIEVPDNLVTLPYERQGTPDRDEHAVRINLGGLSCLVLLARRS